MEKVTKRTSPAGHDKETALEKARPVMLGCWRASMMLNLIMALAMLAFALYLMWVL